MKPRTNKRSKEKNARKHDNICDERDRNDDLLDDDAGTAEAAIAR
jgi:hypothetical protein